MIYKHHLHFVVLFLMSCCSQISAMEQDKQFLRTLDQSIATLQKQTHADAISSAAFESWDIIEHFHRNNQSETKNDVLANGIIKFNTAIAAKKIALDNAINSIENDISLCEMLSVFFNSCCCGVPFLFLSEEGKATLKNYTTYLELDDLYQTSERIRKNYKPKTT